MPQFLKPVSGASVTYMFSLAALAVLPVMSPAGLVRADEIKFIFGADPQYDYYPRQVQNDRTDPTMVQAARLVSLCSDCTKVFAIMGDLTHDGGGRTSYGNAHKKAEVVGVKVLDGLGNHDIDDLADDETTFDSEDQLKHVPPFPPSKVTGQAALALDRPMAALRLQQGWSIFHSSLQKIDFNDTDSVANDTGNGPPCPTFRMSTAHYCNKADAYYYTVALSTPGGATPAAYFVQLHNAIKSNTAVTYLKAVKQELEAKGEGNKPVILGGHWLGGSASQEFRATVGTMNVAAILFGHYSCTDKGGKEHGHCDLNNNTAAELFDSPSNSDTNKHGTPIPAVNGNAILHNIFWFFKIDTTREEVSFKRIDRGRIGDISTYKSGNLANLIGQMSTRGSKAAFSLPFRSDQFYTCSYHDAQNRRCTAQNP